MYAKAGQSKFSGCQQCNWKEVQQRTLDSNLALIIPQKQEESVTALDTFLSVCSRTAAIIPVLEIGLSDLLQDNRLDLC